MSRYVNYRLFEDASAQQVIVERDDGRTERLILARALSASKPIGEAVAGLQAAASIIAIGAPAVIEKSSPAGWAEHFRARLGPMASAFKNTVATAIKQRSDQAAKREDYLRGDAKVDPATLAEARQHMRSVKPIDAARLAIDNPALFGRAAIDNSALANVPTDLLPRVEDALIQHNLVQRYAAIHRVKPTSSDLLADGPDVATAERLAKEAVANHRKAVDEIGDVESFLRSAIEFVAVSAGVSLAEAHQLLMSDAA